MAVIQRLLIALLLLHHQVRTLESAQGSSNATSKHRFCVKILQDVCDAVDLGLESSVHIELANSRCLKCETFNSACVTEASPVRDRHPDYELFPGLGYYKMHTNAQGWQRARLTCLEEGAHLLVVNSEEEVKVVQQFFDRKPSIEGADDTSRICIGVSDLSVKGQHFTELGQPLASSGYVKRASEEPESGPSCSDREQDCASMDKDGLHYTTGCSCKRAFICEQEM